MARVKISWDGGGPVEYDGGNLAMRELKIYIDNTVYLGGLAIVSREKCPDCKEEIDPETCWCGDPMDRHPRTDWHSPIAMGCKCHYAEPVISSKGAGELQYGVEQGMNNILQPAQERRDQGDQLDLEDIINEGKDNGC